MSIKTFSKYGENETKKWNGIEKPNVHVTMLLIYVIQPS